MATVRYRTLLMLPLVCLLLLVAVAEAPSVWHDEPGGACSICQIGHLPFVDLAVATVVHAPDTVGWHEAHEPPAEAVSVSFVTAPSRAPPA